jgi:processing peptidase subunit beta
MVLAAAGAVDHDQLVKSAEQVFGKVPDETPETSVAALVAKVGRHLN